MGRTTGPGPRRRLEAVGRLSLAVMDHPSELADLGDEGAGAGVAGAEHRHRETVDPGSFMQQQELPRYRWPGESLGGSVSFVPAEVEARLAQLNEPTGGGNCSSQAPPLPIIGKSEAGISGRPRSVVPH